MKKIFLMALVVVGLSACNTSENKEVKHEETEHNHSHEHDGCGHSHEVRVVGVAQEGDAASGEVAIKKLDDGSVVTYDYKNSNQDKIAAWLPGDTLTVFIHHHHHGATAHDSITAIKIGNMPCTDHSHDHHNHDHAHDHHGHSH